MYPTASAPQYAFGSTLAPAPMPMYKGGGDVQQTYGLRNAAEQLRERGRGDDTILAHITPEEAGILKLMGGSGTINPYTGLPEFGSWNPFKVVESVGKEIGRAGSSVGKEIERGVETIAKDKILGPIAQFAAAYYGGPIGAALYAGVATPGSSFNTKAALRAGATTAAFNAMSNPDANVFTPRGSITDLFGSGMEYAPMGETVSMAGPGGFEGAASDAATSYLNPPPTVGSGVGQISYTPDPNSFVSGADAAGQFASADVPFSDASSVPASSMPATPERLPTASEQYFDNMMGQPVPYADVAETPYTSGPTDVGAIPGVTTFPYGVENMPQPNIIDKGLGSLNQGYNNAVNYISELPGRALDYASELPGRALDYASELPGRALDYASELPGKALKYAVDDPLRATAYGTMAYGGIQSLREAEKQKEEAERILADQANKKAEEIAWAQSVLRDFPIKYQRLTEEDVRRERGIEEKAVGGRITSYDDEIGGDDNMMQGGIAALAKGGLPPRYLRGGGDGMSDSIRANIEGKQEARLADGEFVVPADVVSHLGNGSSNAGAKKLYAMMDRIRKSRTGKTRQAPEVNTRSMMPA